MAKKLRATTRFFPGTPEEASEPDARWIEQGEILEADDPIVVDREVLFEPA